MSESKNIGLGSEKKGIADRAGWSSRGETGVWQREHRWARRALFNPFRVAAGPANGTHLIRLRKTSGVDLSSMKKFEIIDGSNDCKFAI